MKILEGSCYLGDMCLFGDDFLHYSLSVYAQCLLSARLVIEGLINVL